MSPELPETSRIRALLPRENPWRRIVVVESTGSTNADLAKQARLGEAGPGDVLLALEQRAGKGRLGRQWISPKGSSIALSLLLHPQRGEHEWGWLSLLAGVAVAAAAEELAPAPGRVQLKWPNDVLIDGRKVCGILSERVETPTGAMAITGIGINVTLSAAELPVPEATSLALAGFTTDANELVAAVLRHIQHYYDTWQEHGRLRTQYQQRCASIGTRLSVHVGPGEQVTGVGVGVDDYGRLQVDTGQGVRTFAVGDVVHAKLG